jgi:hypothetical protein
MDTETPDCTFKSFQDVRDYALRNADKIKKPLYESRDYFYGRWMHEIEKYNENKAWDIEEPPKVEVGDLIVYRQRTMRHFYRYGMVAMVFSGSVVTSREVFTVYDLSPAIVMSTTGESVELLSPNYHQPVLLSNMREGTVSDSCWALANRGTLRELVRSLDSEVRLNLANKKIKELEALLKR